MNVNRPHRAPSHTDWRDVLKELGHLRRMASDAQAMLGSLSLEPPEELRIAGCIAGFVDDLSVQIEEGLQEPPSTELLQYGCRLCRRQAIIGLQMALRQLDMQYASLKAQAIGPIARHSFPFFEERRARLSAKLEKLVRTCNQKLNDLRVVFNEVIALRDILDSLEEIRRNARSWGNPRHHLIGVLIALIVGVVLVPLTPVVQDWWTRTIASSTSTTSVAPAVGSAVQHVAYSSSVVTPPYHHNDRSERSYSAKHATVSVINHRNAARRRYRNAR